MLTDYVEIKGAKIYYEVVGKGYPLVLTHAGIADSRMWDDQMAAFSEHYQVIRYDARGYGQSDPVAGEFYHHENLYHLLQHLKIDKAHMLGCSMGGAITLDFTLEYPQMVQSLTLVGSALPGHEGTPSPKPANWSAILAAYEAGDFAPANDYEVKQWVVGPNRQPDAVAATVREKVYAMNLIALRNDFAELGDEQELDPPAISRLGEIKVPTLVIVGDHDQPEMIEKADILANKIARARKVVMTGTAHLPNMEQPTEFNEHVLDLLNRVA